MAYQISWDVINHVSKLIIRLRHRRVELVGNSHGYGVVGNLVGKPFFFSIGFQCLTHKLSMTECELSINPRCVYLVIIRSVQAEAAAKRKAAAA